MIFRLVFDIDVCSGMVAARFISITPLTHLKTSTTQRKTFIQNCTILYRQSPSWASLPHIGSVAIEQKVFPSQARCVEMLWSRSRRHEVMTKGWVGKAIEPYGREFWKDFFANFAWRGDSSLLKANFWWRNSWSVHIDRGNPSQMIQNGNSSQNHSRF